MNERGILQLTKKIETLNTKLGIIINLLSLAGEEKQESGAGKTKKSKKPTNKKGKAAMAKTPAGKKDPKEKKQEEK
ncbi:hypothetical protein ACFLZP_03390 [Patescibacteria group bacterium]